MSLSIKIYIDGTLAKTQQASLPAEGGESTIAIQDIQYNNAETGISWSGGMTLTLSRSAEQTDDRSSGDSTDVIKGSFVKIKSISFSGTRLWLLTILGIAPWEQTHKVKGNSGSETTETKESTDIDDPSSGRRPYFNGNDRYYLCNPSEYIYTLNCVFGVNARNNGSLQYKRDGGEMPCKGEGKLRRDYPNSDPPGQYWEYVRTWEMDELRLYFYLPKAKVNVVSQNDSTGSYYYAMPLGNVNMPSVAGLMPAANNVFAGWKTNLSTLTGDPDATTPWPFNAGDDITMEDFFSGSQPKITDYTELRLQPDKSDTVIGGGKYRYPLRTWGSNKLPTSNSVRDLPTKAPFVIYPCWHYCTGKLIRDASGNLVRDAATGRPLIDL